MKQNGTRILLECLEKEDVRVIFGQPGQVISALYEFLPEYSVTPVFSRSENAAVHAADGYARASGQVGVCIVGSGAGVTNTVTGIATAYTDSIPLVIITGQVSRSAMGNDTFQEVDTVGITRSCTKHNYLVQDVADLSRILCEAFYLARSGRPGPVLVDLPHDILDEESTVMVQERIKKMRGYNPGRQPNQNQLRRAAELLQEAERPVLFVGGGVISANAADELAQLAHLLQLPVVSSLMGLGAFSGADALWFGMLGKYGTFAAKKAVQASDVLFAIGTRFDKQSTGNIQKFAPHARIIHLDIDPTSIGKNISVDVPVVGDCRLGLGDLLQVVEADALSDTAHTRQAWLHQLRVWAEEEPLSYSNSSAIKPQEVLRVLQKMTQSRCIIACDAGQHQMWAAQYFPFCTPRSLLCAGGLGAAGYGLPAAIGAQIAKSDSLVVALTGDNAVQVNFQEFSTAVHYGLPVKVIVLNNGRMGLWEQNRQKFFAVPAIQPDFVRLAEACGAVAYRVTERGELEGVLRMALAEKAAVLVDVCIDADENVQIFSVE